MPDFEDLSPTEIQEQLAHYRKLLAAVDRLILALEEYAELSSKRPNLPQLVENKRKCRSR